VHGSLPYIYIYIFFCFVFCLWPFNCALNAEILGIFNEIETWDDTCVSWKIRVHMLHGFLACYFIQEYLCKMPHLSFLEEIRIVKRKPSTIFKVKNVPFLWVSFINRRYCTHKNSANFSSINSSNTFNTNVFPKSCRLQQDINFINGWFCRLLEKWMLMTQCAFRHMHGQQSCMVITQFWLALDSLAKPFLTLYHLWVSCWHQMFTLK
jgi:hypothetical protein